MANRAKAHVNRIAVGQLFHSRVQVRIAGEMAGLNRLEVMNHRTHQRVLILGADDFGGFSRARIDTGQ